MILNALCDYYDILASDNESGIPLAGYSSAKVAFALNISSDGNILNIISLQVKADKGNKMVPRNMIVPEQVKRSSGISSNFLCDNNSYLFGIEKDKKGIVKIAKKKFENFKELHEKLFAETSDIGAKAVLNFIKKWNPEHSETILKEYSGYSEDILDGRNIVFILDGELGYIHERLEIKKLWEIYKTENKDGLIRQCLVTGEHSLIAKLHPSIKGVSGGQPAGVSIVSFNIASFISYGKEQSYNAPVSENAVTKYSNVLNHILQNRSQRIQVADTTTVFWAESTNNLYNEAAYELFQPGTYTMKDETANIQDKQKEKEIKAVLTKVITGQKISSDTTEIDENKKFYILGLSPNNARLAVRFFHQDTFGGFAQKMSQHYKDLEIEGIPKDIYGDGIHIPLWRILSETVIKNSKDKTISPLLAGAVMRAIITGGVYPYDLYAAILRRIKAEPDEKINYVRAGIIKAYFIRKARISGNINYKEVLTVSLNEESTNTAYRLGRLFALLERAQESVSKDINSTIKDRYFSTASASPRAVFPVLMKLNNHHLAKLDGKGKWLEIEIGKVMDGFEAKPWPAHLNIEEQGLFILGYYHQRQSFFRKKDVIEEKTEVVVNV